MTINVYMIYNDDDITIMVTETYQCILRVNDFVIYLSRSSIFNYNTYTYANSCFPPEKGEHIIFIYNFFTIYMSMYDICERHKFLLYISYLYKLYSMPGNI